MDRLHPPLPRLIQAALVAALLLLLGPLAAGARAGEWMQISCVNPNGTASTSEGWSEATSGGGAPVVSTACGPGTPMQASLSQLAAAPPGALAQLQYTPPAGSSLAGGEVDAVLGADGFGTNSSGSVSAVTEARLESPSTNDVFKQCVAWLVPCSTDSDTLEFSGTVALPGGQGGALYAQASCAPTSTTPCNQNARNGAWATADIAWARLLLASAQSPQGADFSGSALQPGVRGTGHVVFTASEPSGPGIDNVAVAIDGRTVYSANPNSNGGGCVPVGSDPATGALEFDHAQPCLTSEVVDVPVPTQGLSDGRHELAITVTDAAQNSATVLDQTITTSNPHLTPRAHGPRTIRAQFLVHWRYTGSVTRLLSVRALRLPRQSGVRASCAGRGCPRIGIRHVNAAQIARLLHRLTHVRFHAGDRLFLTVTERGHRPLRIVLRFRDGARPVPQLLRG